MSETLVDLMMRAIPAEGTRVVPEVGVQLLHTHADAAPSAVWQEPSLVVVIQGAKQGRLGDTPFRVTSGHMLVVHLPTLMSCDSAELEGTPFLALSLSIDPLLLAGLLLEARQDRAWPIGTLTGGGMESAVAALGPADHLSLARLLSMVDSPQELQVLGPALRRELHFRALCSPAGACLREMACQGSRAWTIWRSIQRLRDSLNDAPDVAELAREAAMSESLYYAEFRRHTGSSPLQYIKQMRLKRARQLLLQSGCGVAQAAFQVGYSSASQFSREFRRAFGHPPSQAQHHPPAQ